MVGSILEFFGAGIAAFLMLVMVLVIALGLFAFASAVTAVLTYVVFLGLHLAFGFTALSWLQAFAVGMAFTFVTSVIRGVFSRKG